MVQEGVRQIFLASYDPFKSADSGDSKPFLDIVQTLEKGGCDISEIRKTLAGMCRVNAQKYWKEFPDGTKLCFTSKTVDDRCYVDVYIDGKPIRDKSVCVKGSCLPLNLRLEIQGAPRYAERIKDIVSHLLQAVPDRDILKHREAMVLVNALAGFLQNEEKNDRQWLDALGEIVDASVLPLTVYLPDTEEGRRLAEKSKNVPIVFVHPVLYDHIWPGIMPHMEDILLLAKPGLLDDLPAMLAMLRAGALRPDMVQLGYELFHNRVNLKAFVRNEDVNDVLPYTTSMMRVMPRKTPVLIIPPHHPMLKQFVSEKLARIYV